MPGKWERVKDPNEVVDFGIDWAEDLDGDTIDTSVWTKLTGSPVIDTQSNSLTVTKLWLSGGTEGETATFLNRITTSGGRTLDYTMTLRVVSR